MCQFMCKASCSKIIESLYLKRETRNHPLATLAPWNMLPLLLPSNRFQLLSLIMCYFCRPSYLVKMICAAFCSVTKPPNLPASHGWVQRGCSTGTLSAELGSATAPLFPPGVRMLGCSTAPSVHPGAGGSGVLRSFLFSFFLPFFLVNSACSGHWIARGHTRDRVPLLFEEGR